MDSLESDARGAGEPQSLPRRPSLKPAADAFKAPPGLLPPKRADGALPGFDLGVVAAARQAASEDHLKELGETLQDLDGEPSGPGDGSRGNGKGCAEVHCRIVDTLAMGKKKATSLDEILDNEGSASWLEVAEQKRCPARHGPAKP